MTAIRPIVRLRSDRLPAGPWIFARLVEPPTEDIPAGEIVELEDSRGRFFGHGFYNARSDIRVRILTTGKRSALRGPRDFLLRKLAAADRVRTRLLRLPEVTDAYRVCHAEGDDLSGLIVDRLGGTLVCELHSVGFYRQREDVRWALGQLYPKLAVHFRVPKEAARAEGFEPEPEEEAPEVEITEHGLKFLVRPAGGHKTGFFCDQRENRRKVARLARGGDFLDLCCNQGGFALHALAEGARGVRAIDLDEKVLERARASAGLNGLDVEFEHADVFPYLRAQLAARRQTRTVVLDPHKIVRDKARLEEGMVKYGDMNALALGVVKPGGLFATFSCSGAVDLPTFVGTVFRAARRAERQVRLLEVLGAAPDHPQRPDFSRSRYLKGLLLAVD